MFTNTKCSIYAGQDKVYTESVCLSTDSKPTTGIANGSVCLEMNTGKKFMFNEDSGEWVEVPSSGGGGGGGGGGNSDFSNWVRCEVTQGTKVVDGADENALILNKSYNDISDGTHIYYIVPSASDAVYMDQPSIEDSIVAFLMLAYVEGYGYQAVGFNVHMLDPGYTSIDGNMIAYGMSTDEPLAFIAIK